MTDAQHFPDIIDWNMEGRWVIRSPRVDEYAEWNSGHSTPRELERTRVSCVVLTWINVKPDFLSGTLDAADGQGLRTPLLGTFLPHYTIHSSTFLLVPGTRIKTRRLGLLT